MQVIINGKEREIAENCTILMMLEQLGQHPQRVAVEVNREIIKRPLYGEYVLQDGDEIEVLQFVGGGENAVTSDKLKTKATTNGMGASRPHSI